jgi:hypothetical protein
LFAELASLTDRSNRMASVANGRSVLGGLFSSLQVLCSP